MRRLARAVAERRVEAARSARRGRRSRSAGSRCAARGAARERQDELVERGVVGLHREAAAAHREDRAQAAASGDRAPPGSPARWRPPAPRLPGLDAVRGAARGATRRRAQVGADEVQRGAVLGRVAGATSPSADEPRGSSSRRGGLAVVVHAVGVRQQAEARDRAAAAPWKARDRLGEPAQRARAQPAQHDAAPPALAQDLVEAVRAPHAEQRARRCRRRRR